MFHHVSRHSSWPQPFNPTFNSSASKPSKAHRLLFNFKFLALIFPSRKRRLDSAIGDFWAPGYIDWFRGKIGDKKWWHQTCCFFLNVSPSCSRHIVQIGCQVLLQQTVHNSLEHGDEKGIALKDTKKETESRRKEQKIQQLYLSAMHWYAWFLLYIYYSNTCVQKRAYAIWFS